VPIKVKMVHVTSTTPLSVMLCHQICGLARATIDPYAKFDVYMSTHYNNMKGDRKCGKWGGLGS